MPIWNLVTNASSTQQNLPPQDYNLQPGDTFNIHIVNVTAATANNLFIDVGGYQLSTSISNATFILTVDANGYIYVVGYGLETNYFINFDTLILSNPVQGFFISTDFPNTANLLNAPPPVWGLLPGDKAIINIVNIFSTQSQEFVFVTDGVQSPLLSFNAILPLVLTIEVLANGNISVADLGNLSDSYSISAQLISIIRGPTIEQLPTIIEATTDEWILLQINGLTIKIGALKPVDGSFYPERDSNAYRAPGSDQINYYGDTQPIAKHLVLTQGFSKDIAFNETIVSLNTILKDSIFLIRLSGIYTFQWELKRGHSKVIKENFNTGKLVIFDIQFAVKKLKPDVLLLVP